MFRKKALSFILIMSLFITIGCQNIEIFQPDKQEHLTINKLIMLESKLLPKTVELKNQIDSSYTDWVNGNIDTSKFKLLCNEYIVQINLIKSEYKQYISHHPMPLEFENNAHYKQYLYAGKELRSDVGIFLVRVTKGQGQLKNLPTNGKVNKDDVEFVTLSDENIKNSYNELLVERFNYHLSLLQAGIKK